MNTPGTIDRDEIGTLALTVLVGVAAAGRPLLIAFVRVLGVGLRTKTEGATGVVVAIVRGEGCAPFAPIVRARAAGRGLEGIPQVLLPDQTWRDDEERLWPHFADPALLPLPRRDLWDTRQYRSIWTGEKLPRWHPLFPRVAMVRTSWGCRMKCSFCIVPHLCGGIHRTRPVQSVVDEIASLDVDHVYFCDDENFIDEPFAWTLAEALDARGVKKRDFAWTRASTVNRSPELLRRWREIGLDARSAPVALPRSSARA